MHLPCLSLSAPAGVLVGSYAICVFVFVCACQKLFHWLKVNAVWEGGKYTDMVIGEALRPEGCTPVWCRDAELLCQRAAAAV